MLKKRLIGVVTIKNGWAVQSFGYCRYLPLGKPEVLVQNLDRWGADEILVQFIDRSSTNLGPDIEALGKISKLGIATPLIYAGGITQSDAAVKVISHGADRILVDAMLINAPQSLELIARELGTQAVIAHLPARMTDDGLMAFDYRTRSERPLTEWIKKLPMQWFSELMITDWQNDGSPNSFDERLLEITKYINKPLLCFGGISESAQIQRLLANPKVVGSGVGNFLNYRELAIQLLKSQLDSNIVRAPYYETKVLSA